MGHDRWTTWSCMQSRVAANDWSRLDAKVGKAICGCLDAGGVHKQDMLPLPRSMWAVEGGRRKDGEDNPWPAPLPKRRVYGQWRSSPQSRQERRHQHRQHEGSLKRYIIFLQIFLRTWILFASIEHFLLHSFDFVSTVSFVLFVNLVKLVLFLLYNLQETA